MTNSLKHHLLITAALAATLAGSMIGAQTANASAGEYDNYLQREMPFVVQTYGLPTLRTVGAQICTWESQGTTDVTPLVNATIARWPMSRSAAINLQVAAENYLGC